MAVAEERDYLPAMARPGLLPLYDTFTEGFGIPDLMEARQLLELTHAKGRQDLPSPVVLK